jgi:hypothetical protein
MWALLPTHISGSLFFLIINVQAPSYVTAILSLAEHFIVDEGAVFVVEKPAG